MNLSQIKNQKLRNLIEKSAMFNALPEAEKTKKIEAMSKLKTYQQEGVIGDFFEKANSKEREDNKKRSVIFKAILEKIKEMDVIVKRMERKEREGIQENEEVKTEERLINQLNNL